MFKFSPFRLVLLLLVTAITTITLELLTIPYCLSNKLKINTELVLENNTGASSHSILLYSQLSHGCIKTAEIIVFKKFSLVSRPNDKVMNESSKPVC